VRCERLNYFKTQAAQGPTPPSRPEWMRHSPRLARAGCLHETVSTTSYSDRAPRKCYLPTTTSACRFRPPLVLAELTVDENADQDHSPGPYRPLCPESSHHPQLHGTAISNFACGSKAERRDAADWLSNLTLERPRYSCCGCSCCHGDGRSLSRHPYR
jgi:hypothetical protein